MCVPLSLSIYTYIYIYVYIHKHPYTCFSDSSPAVLRRQAAGAEPGGGGKGWLETRLAQNTSNYLFKLP